MSTMRTTKLWMASSYGVETGEAVSEGGVSGGGRGGLVECFREGWPVKGRAEAEAREGRFRAKVRGFSGGSGDARTRAGLSRGGGGGGARTCAGLSRVGG